MKSVMKHQFSQTPSVQTPRSTFDRSHGHKTTIDFDYLYPVFVDEGLPGDTYNLSMFAQGRLATPIWPVMDNMFLDTFFFAVPYRLLWENWERFNGQQDNPSDSIDYLIPTATSPASTGYDFGSIYDYMGIPPGVPDLEHSSLFLRAYNLIYNEWFRDENLQDSVTVNKGDGPDLSTDYALLKRGKRHDYFTSCLPFAQKDFGNPVRIPLGTTAPVIGSGLNTPSFIVGADTRTLQADGTANVAMNGTSANGQGLFWQDPSLSADLTEATASTINELRTAFQIQKMMERDARGGTRYVEILKSHFGVTSPDFRLQRPEYLGGGSSDVSIQPVPSTFNSETDRPQGSLAGYGTLRVNGQGFTKSLTEHCVVIGLVCARADLTYQQGLHKKWSRSTRYDHYFPSFAHLGEQAVLNKEIYAQGTAEDDNVFGYNERYAELRYFPSMITGQFRSQNPTSLDSWHLGQDFANLPTLSPQFIVQETPIDRVVALPDEPDILLDIYFRLKHARPLPTYGVPGMIDHF